MPAASTTTSSVVKPAQRPAKRTPWGILFETLIAFTLMLLLLELLFAAGGMGEQEFLRVDPITGVAPMEGKHVTWRTEGYSRTVFNSQCMQDVERSVLKPANTFRIAVLGNSYVEALQVDRRENFCQLLEQTLNHNSKTSMKFEVLNFGVSSYHLGQMYLTLKHRALAFKPDLVLLSMDGATALDHFPSGPLGIFSARPYFYLDTNGRLCQDNSLQNLWRQSAEYKHLQATAWLRQHSRTYTILAKAVGGLPIGRFFHAANNQASSPAVLTGGPYAGITVEPDSPPEKVNKLLPVIYPLAESLLSTMKHECDTHDCRLVLVRLQTLSHLDHQAIDKVIGESAKTLNLPYLDLNPSFDKASSRGEHLFYSHFSPAGHKLVAKEIFDFLLSNKLVPASIAP